MTSNFSKFNNMRSNKTISSFIETGLPGNITEPENNHIDSKNITASKISNKSLSEP